MIFELFIIVTWISNIKRKIIYNYLILIMKNHFNIINIINVMYDKYYVFSNNLSWKLFIYKI